MVGGAGIVEFDGIESCAELQKLYLDDPVKGKGYGKELLRTVENRARSVGYKNLYLETHTNLSAALKLYEKTGFRQIDKPCSTQHNELLLFKRAVTQKRIFAGQSSANLAVFCLHLKMDMV